MTDRKTDSSVPPEDATSESEIERLLHKASYTPRELAELLDVPVSLIEQDRVCRPPARGHRRA